MCLLGCDAVKPGSSPPSSTSSNLRFSVADVCGSRRTSPAATDRLSAHCAVQSVVTAGNPYLRRSQLHAPLPSVGLSRCFRLFAFSAPTPSAWTLPSSPALSGRAVSALIVSWPLLQGLPSPSFAVSL